MLNVKYTTKGAAIAHDRRGAEGSRGLDGLGVMKRSVVHIGGKSRGSETRGGGDGVIKPPTRTSIPWMQPHAWRSSAFTP